MSATEQMRAMISQLMGSAGDGVDANLRRHKFADHRVCKSFLLECCPHDILASTRMDIGECPKRHDFALRADYQNASKEHDFGYEIDAFEHLSAFVAEADKKTELAKKRLAETQEELSAEVGAKLNKVYELAEAISKKLMHAEKIGAEGNVEESLRAMEEAEKIKKEKVTAEIEYRNSMPASSYQQQKLRVCEVCSAYLGIHDNDRRLADHFGGKLHLGFITIREKLEELRLIVEEKRQKGAFVERNDLPEERRPPRYDNRDRRERDDRRNYADDRRRDDRNRNRNRNDEPRNRSRSRERNERNDRASSHRRRRSRSRSPRHPRSSRSPNRDARGDRRERRRDERGSSER